MKCNILHEFHEIIPSDFSFHLYYSDCVRERAAILEGTNADADDDVDVDNGMCSTAVPTPSATPIRTQNILKTHYCGIITVDLMRSMLCCCCLALRANTSSTSIRKNTA